MKRISKLQKRIDKIALGVHLSIIDNCLLLEGTLKNYRDIVAIGMLCAESKLFDHVINEIKLEGYIEEIRIPKIEDKLLDGKRCDVLIIGGGVVGSAIARELSKYELSIMLIDKEEDLAMHASSRNDGCIHTGIDLHHGTEKLFYLQRSLKVIAKLCDELDVDYSEDGQSVIFYKWWQYPLVRFYMKSKEKHNDIKGMYVLRGKKLHAKEPNLAKEAKFGYFFSHAASICPYNFTIALAESAVINGASVYFNTYVSGMDVSDHEIKCVHTNRGDIKAKVVVNAAGVFSGDIAKMAEDKFFSIHPRKGTNSIFDKKTYSVLSHSAMTDLRKLLARKNTHTKGGGVIPTVDKNILVGPDAIEVPYKEKFETDINSINETLARHSKYMPHLSKGDIITYFTGIRAPTYEEDFIVSKGRWTKNIVHAAGIQSPGLSSAPAIAEDIAKYTTEIIGNVKKKDNFVAKRKGIIKTRSLTLEERNKLIESNSDYGVIVCRCEEISKGEIIDAINSIIPATTVDGIKRRVRAGMGRCQGGFCQPLVMQIISQNKLIDITSIKKKGDGQILVGDIKENSHGKV